ncbi:ferredoxin [Oscillibacter ruminantium]|jgi:ferredoxin|uniref:ferredoxin n=1 Tax=Oscillibacter ruminantium TaxID=1263547 RepID=UPI0003009059|nr:ferredoxin [Oscillibacter ruminantium]MDN0033444.1 ferredoxin [Oscillibacter valericigenes]
MRAHVDQDTCIGCGLCISSVPEVFEMNADGKAEAIADGPDDAVKSAIDACPVSAIRED